MGVRTHECEVPVSTLPFLPGELPEPTPEQAAQTPGRGASPDSACRKRDQGEFSWSSLDERLDPDLPGPAPVWAALVCRLDLDAWLAEIKAVEGHVGRNAPDPRLLVAASGLRYLEGDRQPHAELERLCKDHLAYQWLCGGVSVNYHHMLADFRSQGARNGTRLLTQIVATLMAEGLVTMDRVAQDGMRVRANAGGRVPSGTGGRLEQLLEECQATGRDAQATGRNRSRGTRQTGNTAARAASSGSVRVGSRRRRAVRGIADQEEGSKREREERRNRPRRRRASTTDPESRNMKFSDGGCRPGFNVQFATDTATGIVLGVDVTNAGTDSEEMPPMLDQLEALTTPCRTRCSWMGGFASLDAIDATEGARIARFTLR